MLGLQYPLILGRQFHSRPVTFQFVKDVYKKLEYKAPFSDQEREKILQMVNLMPESGTLGLQAYLSQKLSKQIVAHRTSNGLFECVEQILDIPKMETKKLEKACEVLLGQNVEKKKTNNQDSLKYKKYKSMFSKDVIPKPNIKLDNTVKNPTIVSLNITLQRFAFTKIENGDYLSEWVILPAIKKDAISSPLSYQHHRLHELVLETISSLPKADIYLLDEMLPILQQDTYLKSKIHLTMLRCSLISLLSERENPNTGEKVRVHTVRPYVLDTMFNLKIGNERRSLKDEFLKKIQRTQDNQDQDQDNEYRIEISDNQWYYYKDCDSHGKELLLTALARSLAFNQLCHLAKKNFIDGLE